MRSSRFLFIVCAILIFPTLLYAQAQRPVHNSEQQKVKSQSSQDASGLERAYAYLRREMDIYHQCTLIYEDAESGGERFFPSGWMTGPQIYRDKHKYNIAFNPFCTKPHNGSTCIEISWYPEGRSHWVGIYWQYPDGNWGRVPGHNLEGSTILTFWARGDKGDEWAKFSFGGLIPKEQDQYKYKDSAKEKTTGWVKLERQWQKYTIDLRGADLSNIIGGFCWIADYKHNKLGCKIYLDDIRIVQSRLKEPHLIRSYYIGGHRLENIKQLRNICYVYDNALAICAFLMSNKPDDKKRAKLIADAFVCLAGYEKDCCLRNAYCCGDLFVMNKSFDDDCDKSKFSYDIQTHLPGWVNRGDTNVPFPLDNPWLVDSYAMGTDTGNMAWVMLALLNYWEFDGKVTNSPYLKTAMNIGKWVLVNCSNNSKHSGLCKDRGFTGGVEWDPNTDSHFHNQWKSTEHNIDLYAAFSRLAIADKANNKLWEKAAISAAAFVQWAAEAGKAAGEGKNEKIGILTGTANNGEPNLDIKPLDPQTWSILAFPERACEYRFAFEWALTELRIPKEKGIALDKGIWGYGFSTASRNIWPEGTAQVALVHYVFGEYDEAWRVIEQLEMAQHVTRISDAADGALPAAYPGIVNTGIKKSAGYVKYYGFPHIGATSWYIMAKMKWNPFTGHPIKY